MELIKCFILFESLIVLTASDGSISFEKFLVTMRRYQATPGGGPGSTGVGGGNGRSPNRMSKRAAAGDPTLSGDMQDLVDAAFRIFDKDRDGFLNAFDLR